MTALALVAETVNRDPDLEWLDLVRPTGLVLSPTVIKERGLVPERQTAIDSALFAACLGTEDEPALPDPWRLFTDVLDWDNQFIAGGQGGPPLTEDLSFYVQEHDTLLEPHLAVQGFGEDAPWQLLVRIEEAGVDPDQRAAADGWEASPHQRFERLLRETGVLVGVMIAGDELRLIYAPKGETSGWLAFPLRSLGSVAGRPMLAGLKLLLDGHRLFNAGAEQRLRALLQASRDAQAAVSTELAGQVLGALHELLRGLHAAEPALIRNLAEERPDHLYQGLLTVMLRLVFVLYAEDRDLLPSATGERWRRLYEDGYALRGLYEKLNRDAALNPDTMDERRGAWGRLLALFRLIHKGHASGFIHARRGQLFDPDLYPFLENRAEAGDPPRVMKVSDGCILRILEGLMTLHDRATKTRQRLSYRTLDVEQIGSVYETIMGFTVQAAGGRVLAIKAGKHNRTPVFSDIDHLAALKPADRPKYLKEEAKRDGTLPKAVADGLKSAKDADAIAAALDPIADERGSPKRLAVGEGTPILQPTEERRRTGSHYTPRALSEPIVREALRPIFERVGPDAKPAQILDIRVCDPAMGSGAFLVEACRQLAERLVAAWARHAGTRPPIPADEDEHLLARRLVAQRCLYGVDRNPMAVDLARLSLWLATLARDHEFTFLDHALKSGDSLVGLDLDSIEAVHWDASARDAQPGLRRAFVSHCLQAAEAERQRIRDAVEDASEDDLRPMLERANRQLDDPKLMGDAVIAAFFQEAKAKDREKLRSDIQVEVEVGGIGWQARLAPFTEALSLRPFHWPLEFPEVFDRPNGGFDVIVGNPPFLGGSSISGHLGDSYRDWLKEVHEGAHGNADLVAHFFRRAYALLRKGGTFGLIATNTISQGDTRSTGLAAIRANGGSIYSAKRRIKWPGEAAVVVAAVHVLKGLYAGDCLLDERSVKKISAFLFHSGEDNDPFKLHSNSNKSFKGSFILGLGFTFDDQNLNKGSSPLVEMDRLIEKDPRNADRIFPYIGGAELNSSPTHSHHRYVINFEDLNEDEAWRWPDLMKIVEEKVRPVRATDNRKAYRDYWWRFAERRAKLRSAIGELDHVLALSQTSTHYGWTMLPNKIVFDQKLVVVASDSTSLFACLQSRLHEVWAKFLGSSMKDDPVYTPSDCFETFPFPRGFETDATLEQAGQRYYEARAALMVERDKGLTKTYNDFHDRRIKTDQDEGIDELRHLHRQMDQAVFLAYGWEDLAENARPIFLDEANEDAFAYQGRLFWPSDFRDDVLARLLALNAERHEEEVVAGLFAAPKAKPKKSRRSASPHVKTAGQGTLDV